MPSTLTALAIALALFVAALGLISTGSDRDIDPLWAVGLGLLALGGAIGPLLHFAGDDGEDA